MFWEKSLLKAYDKYTHDINDYLHTGLLHYTVKFHRAESLPFNDFISSTLHKA